MSSMFQIDTSSLNENEKLALLQRLKDYSFIFTDEYAPNNQSKFRFLPEGEKTIEEVREYFQIPDSCTIEII